MNHQGHEVALRKAINLEHFIVCVPVSSVFRLLKLAHSANPKYDFCWDMLQKRIDDQPSISREMTREAQQILHQHLKSVGLKHTEQRDTILQTFLETREHLSVNELHRLVQKKDARIGFTTVYRTLKVLAECGLASEVAFHDGIARYEHQYNRRGHHHMVCTACGSSVEFFSTEVDQLEHEIGRKYNYATTRHTFQIYGLCEDCRSKDDSRRVR
jgi:Fur family ferric uptake transcriptional regulator